MLLNLFHTLRSAGVPVSLREHLALIEAMSHDLAEKRVEDFYFFSPAPLMAIGAPPHLQCGFRNNILVSPFPASGILDYPDCGEDSAPWRCT